MAPLFIVILSALILFFLFIISILRSFLSKTLLPLPPGPHGLPIIGNLHQLYMTDLSDHLWHLSKLYGPLMSIRLGMVQTIVVSSAEMAKEVMKTNDLNFCTRPVLTGLQKISYDNKDIVFSPYSDYWRQMRKICMLNLFSVKHVNSFRCVREEEVFNMIDTIKTQILTKQVVNLSETVMILTSNIISRVAFGKRSAAYANKQQEAIRLQKNLLECQALLVHFYFKDKFPFMGWLDKLNGTIARLEKNVKDMDEFYQQVIDEHLNPERLNIMHEDMVDILLKLKHDPDSSVNLTFDHIKAVLMVIHHSYGVQQQPMSPDSDETSSLLLFKMQKDLELHILHNQKSFFFIRFMMMGKVHHNSLLLGSFSVALVFLLLPCLRAPQVVQCYVHLPSTNHSHVTKVMWPFCVHLEATVVLHRPTMMWVTEVIDLAAAHYIFATELRDLSDVLTGSIQVSYNFKNCLLALFESLLFFAIRICTEAAVYCRLSVTKLVEDVGVWALSLSSVEDVGEGVTKFSGYVGFRIVPSNSSSIYKVPSVLLLVLLCIVGSVTYVMLTFQTVIFSGLVELPIKRTCTHEHVQGQRLMCTSSKEPCQYAYGEGCPEKTVSSHRGVENGYALIAKDIRFCTTYLFPFPDIFSPHHMFFLP
ncbi:cytochrome P450 [Artemisia annua]|uniref:Cytochrome P450 n=1 Tax=Artemisia annua TaxID=35608 RepID=A0A2U1M6N1_ARTAN|nr:cytochrome P450 [Artemisia annua]